MILGDSDLIQLINKGCVTHSNYKLVNPASINVRVGYTFLIPRRKIFGVTLGGNVSYKRVEIDDEEVFTLRPGEFVLATTQEHVTIPPQYAAFVQGRSSIGRAGLSVQNAGFVDPGFHGHITLELKNETGYKIHIVPGYPVAQLVFFKCTQVQNPYSGKYNGQVEATGSRMHLDNLA